MEIGGLTEHVDVAQVVLFVFWIFFAGLLFYLQRETRREGYPLENDVTGEIEPLGPIFMPDPKTFHLANGQSVSFPDYKRETRPMAAEPVAPWPGAPIEPTGDPMTAGVGPGSWAEREDVPDMTHHNTPKIQPMRVAGDFYVAEGDADPRGMSVVAGDGVVAGTVKDVWVDVEEVLIRYLEVESGGKTVLVPWMFSNLSGGKFDVDAIFSEHFANVPGLKNPDQVTRLEEEKITAYFGAGTLYASPIRSEPIV